MRNRLLSGLAKAVLVVEAGEKSGSLITVEHALAQGKSVFVVPGRVDRPEALGCLRLLREGAAPAIEPEDIVLALLGSAALGSGRSDGAPEAGGRRAGAGGPLPAGPSALSGRMGRDLELLFREEDIWHPDDLAERLGLSVPEMIRELSRLELAGALRRLPGGAFAKT
jgi:DNA processing protein